MPHDPDMLILVLQNLTSNAVKFNRHNGMIRVVLPVQDREIKFTISNTGCLIPGEEREKIFNRFNRVDKSRSQRTPGTGLGLTLAREVGRAHGGDLYLNDSREDVNSFTLSLP